MSFRKKNRKAKSKEEEDVKVVKESKSKDQSPPESSQQAAQTTGQQSGQESGQPTGQSDAQSDDKSSGDEDDDKSDESEPVPAGTTAEILRWVGDDKQRAQSALDKEQAEDKPRGGLTGELKKILG